MTAHLDTEQLNCTNCYSVFDFSLVKKGNPAIKNSLNFIFRDKFHGKAKKSSCFLFRILNVSWFRTIGWP